MSTIKQEAQAYEPKQTKNIADLDVVNVDLTLTDETYPKIDEKTGEETTFTIKVVNIDGEDYRLPISVLKSLKAILEEKPDLKTFKVKKTGKGMNTEYTVIPLD